jgi:hypothetical protein
MQCGERLSYFSFGERGKGGVGFLLFSMCSHELPNVFPNI